MKPESIPPRAGTCTLTWYSQPLSKSSACFGSSLRCWVVGGRRCPPPSIVSSNPPNFRRLSQPILPRDRRATNEGACVGVSIAATRVGRGRRLCGLLRVGSRPFQRRRPQDVRRSYQSDAAAVVARLWSLSGQRLRSHRCARSRKFRRDKAPCHRRAGSSGIVGQGGGVGNGGPYLDVH